LKGAVGAANVTGSPDEADRELLRIPDLHVGAAALSGIAFANLPPTALTKLNERVGADTNGLLGGEAFHNCRVGIDYAHQTVYVDVVNHKTAPDMDGVGLTLHPTVDGHFAVSAVLSIDGKSTVPDVKAGDVLVGVDGAPVTGATLGQTWSLLSGTPGQSRALTLERDGKRFTVNATVRRFLALKNEASVKSPRRNPQRRN
jgi:S1-C subfamily serine protease